MADALPRDLDSVLAAIDQAVPCPECLGISRWKKKVSCRACDGNGATAEVASECEQCGGKGVIVSPQREASECSQCDGYGAIFVACDQCNGAGFTYHDCQCDHCDADGNVSLAKRVAVEADRAYVTKLFAHMVHYAESGKEDDVMAACKLFLLLTDIASEVNEEDEERDEDICAGIDDELMNDIRQELTAKLQAQVASTQRLKQVERETARLEQIEEAAALREEFSRTQAELLRKFGRDGL